MNKFIIFLVIIISSAFVFNNCTAKPIVDDSFEKPTSKR